MKTNPAVIALSIIAAIFMVGWVAASGVGIEVTKGLLIAVGAILAALLAICAILMPVFVYLIYRKVAEISLRLK